MVPGMGNVIFALDDDYEKLLRNLAKKKHGGKKGALSKVVSEALRRYNDEDEREVLIDQFFTKMQKGLSFEYKMYKHRSEIYD
jgi:hypothetical protein